MANLAYNILRPAMLGARYIPGLHGLMRRALPPLLATINGRRYRLHAMGNLTEWLMFQNRDMAEPQSIAELVTRLRQKAAVFLDVGANCGSYTISIAGEVLPGSRIIAIEPNPEMVRRIEDNIALNDFEDLVEVLQIALGEGGGTAELFLDDQNFGESSLIGGPNRAGKSVTVQVRALSDIVGEISEGAIFAIKIDVEGFEDRVLVPFLKATERRPDLLMLETEHSDDWDEDLVQLLQELHYTSVFDGEGNTLFQLTDQVH